MVLTNYDPHRSGRLTSHMAPDLQERLRAEATRRLAAAGLTPEPVIEPTRDEPNHATPVFWPGPLVGLALRERRDAPHGAACQAR
jgi:hypothetical protein